MAKYCPYCGALIEDDVAAFCPNCGGSTAATGNEATPIPQYQQPVQAAQPVQPVQPANPMYQSAPEAQFAQPPMSKPKKKFPVKTSALAIIALVLAAVYFFVQPVHSYISGQFIKTFKSDEEYFAFVEEEAMSDYTDSFVNWYENYLEGLKNGSIATDTEIALKLGQLPKSLLSSYTGLSEEEIQWIDNTKFRYTTNMKDGKVSYGMGLNIGNTDIASVLAVLDNSDQTLLLSMKELTDNVLKIDLSDAMSDSEAFEAFETWKQAADILPDAKTVRNLVDKYFKIIMEQSNNSAVSDEEFEVGDISQKLTVIETKINEKFLYSAALAVLKEAKDDKEIKKILNDIEAMAKETGMAVTGGDTYSQFQEGISSACDTVQSQLDQLKGDGNEFAIWYDYVNSSHEIVGHKIALDGQVLAEYVKLKNGDKIAVEAVVPNKMTIKGSGTESSGKKNATYDIEIIGSGKIKLIQEDYKVDAFKKGELEGTIRIIPDLDSFGLDASELIPSELSPILSVLKPELKMVFSIKEKTEKIALELLNDGELLVGLDSTSKISGGETVSLPEGNVIDVNNEEQLEQFVSGLKLDTLVTNLEKAGLPSSLTSALSAIVSNLSSSSVSATTNDTEFLDDSESVF